MATPQDPQAMAAMVDAIASRQMGVDPQAAPQGQMPPGAPPQAMPQQMPQPPKESATDKADAKGSPKTEGDSMNEAAIIYEVEFGENEKRKLTPQQIKSTFERYRDLNFKNAQYKPVMDLVEQIMRENPGMNPAQMAGAMANVYKAQQSNPTMGNEQGTKSGDYQKDQAVKAGDLDSMLKKWEDDNAASLPPGYKDMLVGQARSMQSMQQQLMQTQAMLQQVMAQSQGVADAAKQGMQQGQSQQITATRQQIANNLDRVQAALKLPDDKANDFMVFAAERGYTMEDFVDPQLTIKVMSDFKNNMDGPEMERMRGIAQRRQAFTGSLGSAPGAVPSPEAGAPGESTFDRFSQMAMNKRFTG